MRDITREKVFIDRKIGVGHGEDWIGVRLEVWFDINNWVNLYAIYSPSSSNLTLEYFIDANVPERGPFPYDVSEAERNLIIELIEETCMKEYGHSAIELVSMD